MLRIEVRIRTFELKSGAASEQRLVSPRLGRAVVAALSFECGCATRCGPKTTDDEGNVSLADLAYVPTLQDFRTFYAGQPVTAAQLIEDPAWIF